MSVTFDLDGFYGGEDAVFHAGTWYPDPEFCIGCAGNLVGLDTHDVAVVILDEPVPLDRYASLPTEGPVDRLTNKTRATAVGSTASRTGRRTSTRASCSHATAPRSS